MPRLATVTLPNAFQYYDEWSVVNAGKLANHLNLISHTPTANVFNVNDLNALSSTVTEIIVENRCCRDPSFTVLDLRRFTNVRRIVIGHDAFMYVEEVKLIGLSELESVEIGMNSFTEYKNGAATSATSISGYFHLKNCPKLKSLKIGRYSFNGCIACEIENVNALESIEMGELNAASYCFEWSSLELRSVFSEQCVMTRHAFSQITRLWWKGIPV